MPLYLLAGAAPLLWQFQKYFVYRLAWNLGLMAIFALLVQDLLGDIMAQEGVRFLLEDGLILAAFCQVHILNNLAKQRCPWRPSHT